MGLEVGGEGDLDAPLGPVRRLRMGGSGGQSQGVLDCGRHGRFLVGRARTAESGRSREEEAPTAIRVEDGIRRPAPRKRPKSEARALPGKASARTAGVPAQVSSA